MMMMVTSDDEEGSFTIATSHPRTNGPIGVRPNGPCGHALLEINNAVPDLMGPMGPWAPWRLMLGVYHLIPLRTLRKSPHNHFGATESAGSLFQGRARPQDNLRVADARCYTDNEILLAYWARRLTCP